MLNFLWTLGLAAVASAQNATVNFVPLPKDYTNGTTPICLADDFSIQISNSNAPQDLHDAVGRTFSAVWAVRHEYLSTTFGTEFFADPSNPCQNYLHTLTLTINGTNTDSIFDSVILDPDDRMQLEGYTMWVSTSGDATITAKSALGLLRGLSTFETMWFYLAPAGQTGNALRKRWSGGEALYAPFGPYWVDDYPTFGWRAVLLDTSRHYFPISSLKSMLDTMSLVKMTTWHWHITDSQSWPLELSSYPELANKGAYSPARHYSEADVKDLVQYAGVRGIDVVMEIDSPGHTASIAYSHPEYVACFQESPWTTFANEPPPGALRFADPQVSLFMQGVFRNAISLISSPFFATGGDEINMDCLLNDTQSEAMLQKYNWTFTDALNNFTGIAHEALWEANKTAVVWEEMVDAFGNITNLRKDAVVLVWIDSTHNREVADLGYRLVHASSDYFYLDCGQGEWIGINGGANSWCDPFKSWEHIYSFDPFANLTEAQESQVLGGQVSLWTEQTDHTNMETVMWPRAAALAELFWTGPGPNGSYPRLSNDAFPRMHDIRYRMVDRGIRAEPIAPEWCALRPGQCNINS